MSLPKMKVNDSNHQNKLKEELEQTGIFMLKKEKHFKSHDCKTTHLFVFVLQTSVLYWAYGNLSLVPKPNYASFLVGKHDYDSVSVGRNNRYCKQR